MFLSGYANTENVFYCLRSIYLRLFRLQHNVPLSLTTKDEVQMFFDGTLPKHAKKATDIAVVGMFADEKCKGNL